MKRNVRIRVISLVAAAVLLCGALAAAAITGSPYETLKSAAFDALTLSNATITGEASIYVDGQLMTTQKIFSKDTEDESYSGLFDDEGAARGFSYQGKELNISTVGESSTGETRYSAYSNNSSGYSYDVRTSVFGISSEDLNTAEMRFMEMLLDVMVGDLKNNVTMSSDGDTRIISGTLTAAQIPELVNAGLDALTSVSMSGRTYSDSETLSYDAARRVQTVKRTTIEGAEKTVEVVELTLADKSTEEYWDSQYGWADVNGKTYVVTAENVLSSEVTAATAEDYGDDLFSAPPTKIRIDYVHGEATVDGDGHLNAVDGRAIVNIEDVLGKSYAVEIAIALDISDIGTTVVECPIPNAAEVLAPYFTSGGNVYFTLNPDGTINVGSISENYRSDIYWSADERVFIEG